MTTTPTPAIPTTLAALMARTTADGNCRVWDGCLDTIGSPKICINYKKLMVRRLVWQLVRGPIAPKHQISTTCGTPGCIATGHLISRTQSQTLKGRPVSRARRIRTAITHRAKATAKLTAAQVAEIRASSEPGTVLDRRYGLSSGYASHIRRGRAWRDYTSPFAGLVPA